MEAKDYYEAPTKSYHENLKDYFKSPHKVMFGWFGNWAGKNGASMQYALCGLPDSVDFVSLWLCWEILIQRNRLICRNSRKKGSKAVLCWRAGDIGDNLTPGGNGTAEKMNFGVLILQMKKRILKPQKNMLLQLLILAISIMLMVLIMILKTGGH